MKGFAAQFNQLFGELYECVKKSEQETLPGHQKLPLSAGEFHLLEQIDPVSYTHLFSGKDPTKVDRSAAYMARHVAKNIVAAGLAKKCQIELAYAIGVARPVSVLIDTYGTGVLPDEKLAGIVDEVFDLRPASRCV